MKAAVLHEAGQSLAIEDVDIDSPQAREVLVRTAAAGVCHSDLHMIEGRHSAPTPAVLGHEASGIVEAVGDRVTEFQPGDHVVACASVFCGRCERCMSGRPYTCLARPKRTDSDPSRLSIGRERINQFAEVGGFAEMMLLHENSIVKVPAEVGLDRAALFGCAISTGVGAVLNTAKVEAGSTVAVFGAGGIGLAAIQGARIAGALRIIAVDITEEKLKKAAELGATDVIDGSRVDPVAEIHRMTGWGVDYGFEAIGLKETSEQAYAATRLGGACTIIGVVPDGITIEVDGWSLMKEKKLQGSDLGSNRFRIDIPRYIDFYLQGRLKVDEMISRRGSLDEINELYRALSNREVARAVITFDG